ncbi:LacI family DNA-binding transcriptional regulator [Nocardioides pyridinolyticus]
MFSQEMRPPATERRRNWNRFQSDPTHKLGSVNPFGVRERPPQSITAPQIMEPVPHWGYDGPVAEDEDRELTLRDIARMAGVGLGTASRALGGQGNVAPATRERVLAVAREHAYVVSPEASRLAGRKTRRVAVLVPHLSRWFFGAMLDGVESVLRDEGMDLLLYHVGDMEDRHEFFEKLPARRKVDVVIAIAFPVEELERRRLERLLNVNVVAAGGQQAAYPHVCIDDLKAGRQAVDHLIGLGHRDIAMIAAVDPEQPVEPSGRTSAYYDALRDAGLPVDPRLVVTTDWGGENGAHAMSRLLSQPRVPTAVYAHSDEVAFGAMRSIRRAGLRIPEDISIVGIDDHPHAELLDLTTVRQPVYEQGQMAARLAMTVLDPQVRAEPESVVVPTQLIIRTTTGPPTPAR